jgi:hypothetical protein
MKALGKLFDIIPVIVPVDLSGGANAGDYISLKNANGVTFVVFKGAGTAGDDPDITVRQAKTVAGGDVKDLDAITEVYRKQGTLTAVGAWSKDTQAADALYDANATSAESQAMYVLEVEADQLDVDGGFDCVTLNIADVGTNAQLGCAFAILWELKKAAAPEDLVSSIAD